MSDDLEKRLKALENSKNRFIKIVLLICLTEISINIFKDFMRAPI